MSLENSYPFEFLHSRQGVASTDPDLVDPSPSNRVSHNIVAAKIFEKGKIRQKVGVFQIKQQIAFFNRQFI